MDESSLQTMTSTLASQPSSTVENASAADQPAEPSPVKRTPGRPKGSGKKEVDPNAPPKLKRPVGRPRKDGLPAGSVQRSSRPVGRPRKRPSEGFAAARPEDGPPPPPMFSFASHPPPYGGYLPWPPGGPSVTVAGTVPIAQPPIPDLAYPIDPALDQDGWAEMSRSDPQAFLRRLVESLSSPNPMSASGSTVEEAFKSHLSSLAPLSKTTPSIPSLYAILKTFWLPSSPAYFSLTASASTARTPSEYRFLYWDPQPLVFNGIACPSCAAPLINRGRIRSGPLKIHDLNGKPFFVIGCEYACTSATCVAATSPEGRKFASTDASIFRALPLSLKNEFPARLSQGDADLGSGSNVWNWHAMGVSDALWNMVRGCLKAGLRKDVILNIIKGIQEGVPDDAPKKKEEEEDGDDDNQDETQGGNVGGRESLARDYQQAQNGDSQPKASSSSTALNGDSSGRPQMSMMAPPPELGFNSGSYAPYPYGPHPYFPLQQTHNPDPSVTGSSPSENIASKRPFPFAADGASDSASAVKRIRHCCKCGSSECKGKGGRAFCTSACQDCGKVEECKGRNSKRPDKSCADAWA